MWQRRWWLLTAAIAVIIDGGSNGIEPTAPMAVSLIVAVVVIAVMMDSLPLPPTTMAATLALIALTHSLPWMRIG